MAELQAFGERLAQLRREKAAREQRDIGQKDVARAAKVAATNYSKYEAGLVKPRDDVLGRIADYFGVRRAWLLWGEGEREAVTVDEVVAVAAPPKRKPHAGASPRARRKGAG